MIRYQPHSTLPTEADLPETDNRPVDNELQLLIPILLRAALALGGQEYDTKMVLYAELGVLYYTIYNPHYGQRDQHQPFEVYRLIEGCYVLQHTHPVWMPEIGLGIGIAQGSHEGLPLRDWLYWYDPQGQVYPVPENVIALE